MIGDGGVPLGRTLFAWAELPRPGRDNKKIPSTKVLGIWWARVDSNHRSIKQQIYSLSPLATREHAHIHFRGVRFVCRTTHLFYHR